MLWYIWTLYILLSKPYHSRILTSQMAVELPHLYCLGLLIFFSIAVHGRSIELDLGYDKRIDQVSNFVTLVLLLQLTGIQAYRSLLIRFGVQKAREYRVEHIGRVENETKYALCDPIFFSWSSCHEGGWQVSG
jgi:hypothetical protein